MKKVLMFLLAGLAICKLSLYSDDPTISYDSNAKGQLRGMYVAPDSTKTFPISGTVTATGGAQETTQLLIKTYMQQLRDGVATETTLQELLTQVEKLSFDGTDLKVKFSNTSLGVTGTFWQSTQPISAVSLPLPLGAASEAKLNILAAYLKKLSDTVNDETQVDVNIKNTSLAVTGSFYPETQPVSGSVTVSGTDIDIRALSSASDSVEVKQATASNLKTEPNLTDLTYSDTMSYVTCADSGLWYSFVLPAKTVAFTLHARTGYDIKISKDAAGTQYWTIWAGESFPPTPAVREGYVSGTYYINSPDCAGLVVEAWIRKED